MVLVFMVRLYHTLVRRAIGSIPQLRASLARRYRSRRLRSRLTRLLALRLDSASMNWASMRFIGSAAPVPRGQHPSCSGVRRSPLGGERRGQCSRGSCATRHGQ